MRVFNNYIQYPLATFKYGGDFFQNSRSARQTKRSLRKNCRRDISSTSEGTLKARLQPEKKLRSEIVIVED